MASSNFGWNNRELLTSAVIFFLPGRFRVCPALVQAQRGEIYETIIFHRL